MKKYEALFILPDSLKEDSLAAALAKAQEEIQKLGGKVESVTPLGKRAFARPLKKKGVGHYVLVVFSMAPDQIASLQARYRLDENIFRVQIVVAPGGEAGRITIPPESVEQGE